MESIACTIMLESFLLFKLESTAEDNAVLVQKCKSTSHIKSSLMREITEDDAISPSKCDAIDTAPISTH